MSQPRAGELRQRLNLIEETYEFMLTYAAQGLTGEDAGSVRGSPAVGDHGGCGRTAGQPLPVLDRLLAATAVAVGLTLVTRNTAHMQATGVLVAPWAT